MKELKKNVYYSEKYDININTFLTYAQIQKIIETTMKYKTWAERRTNIDMMILCYATDIGVKKVQEIGIDAFIESGLIDEVYTKVENHYEIFDGLEYHESVAKALFELSEKLPEIKENLSKELNKK